ncbi:OmpA family protein [Spirochaeta africana]|uniref:Outer membrane protein/peptidoglycan-associated (Lipo)protein n=1 Tax=Spirochaeta africana (strain ATCC 700263 / DSM 8902 / Z-7692) TaxID=889378 RepID=H9UKQ1_SPIAZ|nr:OmpA family protein [Spirochaeta africana]AFG38094.1 outer membrane protein/peptidoglycan-associated (lipo)protein [Spirochaeta africana DSM 8902]
MNSAKRCLVRIILAAAAVLTVVSGAAASDVREVDSLGGGVELRFRYQAGERYRILSTVRQNVFVDGRFSHSAEILNRLQISIEETEGRRGYILLDYESGEMVDFAPGVYHTRNRYHSEFWRDEFGVYEISDEYFVPVVRNVPVWPDHPLRPGDTWSYDGYEVHDFREPFGIAEPYRFPVPVRYTYLGAEEINGRIFDVVEIDYTVFHRSPRRTQSVYPATVSGYSEQLLYFDRENGRPAFYEEEYDLEIRMNTGAVYRFTGTADAHVVESERLDRDRVRDDIRRELEQSEVPDASVEEHERGITIRLSDIQFPPDSAELLPSEREKIRRIGDILRQYPDHDVLVSGHTALAGTPEGRMRLSEQRAAAVGRYLTELGVRDPDRLFIEGHGAEDPVAPNDTEDGRRRNRRVEMTIIDD